VYDSLKSSKQVQPDVLLSLFAMYHQHFSEDAIKVILVTAQVQKMTKGSHTQCADFALATAVLLLMKENEVTDPLDQSKLREWVQKCYQNKQFTTPPLLSAPR
jgi:hypothetical protein